MTTEERSLISQAINDWSRAQEAIRKRNGTATHKKNMQRQAHNNCVNRIEAIIAAEVELEVD